jgi:hypothetical protein
MIKDKNYYKYYMSVIRSKKREQKIKKHIKIISKHSSAILNLTKATKGGAK